MSRVSSVNDADTETRRDVTRRAANFQNPVSFRQWVKIFDRIDQGEMPPAGAPQPSTASRAKALAFLSREWKRVNQRSPATEGRVRSRRLARQEYERFKKVTSVIL